MSISISTLHYIAHENPQGVDTLVYQLGFEPPQSDSERVTALKELAQEPAYASQIMALHPEKEAEELCFCGGCGQVAYSGESSIEYPPDRDNLPMDSGELQALRQKVERYRTIALVTGLTALFLLLQSLSRHGAA